MAARRSFQSGGDFYEAGRRKNFSSQSVHEPQHKSSVDSTVLGRRPSRKASDQGYHLSDHLTQVMIDRFDNRKVSYADNYDNCDSCGRDIRDEVTLVGNKHFHPHCLNCRNCHKQIRSGNFYVIKGNNYCGDCRYLFMEKCSRCGLLVEHSAVKTRKPDMIYHPDCFKCDQCHKVIFGKFFRNPNGLIICEDDFTGSSEKCHRCGKHVGGSSLRAMGKHYHPDCFMCSLCPKKLDGDEFFLTEGSAMPICREDYMKYEAKDCSGCGRKICASKFIEKDRKFYHHRCIL